MQGRTSKSSRKELVIESPQQFKYAPVREEEEGSGGPQVRHALICLITFLFETWNAVCCVLFVEEHFATAGLKCEMFYVKVRLCFQ